jgi:hypothetical protein
VGQEGGQSQESEFQEVHRLSIQNDEVTSSRLPVLSVDLQQTHESKSERHFESKSLEQSRWIKGDQSGETWKSQGSKRPTADQGELHLKTSEQGGETNRIGQVTKRPSQLSLKSSHSASKVNGLPQTRKWAA